MQSLWDNWDHSMEKLFALVSLRGKRQYPYVETVVSALETLVSYRETTKFLMPETTVTPEVNYPIALHQGIKAFSLII